MNDNVFNLDVYLSKRFLIKNNVDIDKYQQKIILHNKNFIRKKLNVYSEYFDNMFNKINSNIKLDYEQRLAILTDEDYNLIVAGAGAGKTTTMTAKIKYLVEKCNIKPNDILAISFARKNVKELDTQLNKIFKLGIKTMTFHQLGNEILKSDENLFTRPVDESERYKIIINYIKDDIYKNPVNLKQLTHFLICYFNGDKTMENFKDLKDYHEYITENLFKTLKSDLSTYNEKIINKRKAYKRTIHDEYLHSNEEVAIANFLYLNNIDYRYEPRIRLKKGDYRPDFQIIQGENSAYLEHYGISENGQSSIYNLDDRNKYIHAIKLKDQYHHRNGSILIKTFSKYNDQRPLLDHLKEELEKQNFILKRKNEEEIFYELADGNFDSYFYPFIILLLDFISQFKLNFYTNLNLDELINKANNDRTKKFLITIKPIFMHYQNYLKENSLIDFEDMITKASLKLDTIKKDELNFKYKYIIIDEYQDISKQRYDLIKKLSDKLQAKIVAVGDDWQSIFAFAGSEVELFSKFQDTMGYGEILKIRNTYRNAQELIDVAGEFVQKDKSHITKKLISTKHITKPIIVYSYDDEIGTVNLSKSIAISKSISNILSENPTSKILLIGRYNFDLNQLFKSGLFQKGEGDRVISLDNPDAYIEFFTVHRSKGLEFDDTIIINAINSHYGFPSKIKDDPIFEIFDKKKENMAYAEERRLFYVALTRTKNKVYIIVPKSKPSPFVIELEKSTNVLFKDNVIETYRDNKNKLKCPICKSPLKKGYDQYLNGYIYKCINEKELCNFKTNELIYKIPIRKCPRCADGYLLFKKELPDGSLFIGCSNYKESGEGCNCYIKIDKDKKIKSF